MRWMKKKVNWNSWIENEIFPLSFDAFQIYSMLINAIRRLPRWWCGLCHASCQNKLLKVDEEGDKSAFKEDEPCYVFNEFYEASSLP